MAIAWPASLPLPERIGFQWRSEQGYLRSPYDGSDEVNKRYAELHATLGWNNLDHDGAHRLSAFLGAGDAKGTAYDVPLWHVRQQLGTAGGSFVAGAGAVGDETLSISGGTGSFSDGDWCSIAGHAYQINSGGSTSIQIVGGLRVLQGGGSVMKYLGDTAGTTLLTTNMVLADFDTPLSQIFPAPAPGYFSPFVVEFVSSLRT